MHVMARTKISNYQHQGVRCSFQHLEKFKTNAHPFLSGNKLGTAIGNTTNLIRMGKK
jgi:hypothetical protein